MTSKPGAKIQKGLFLLLEFHFCLFSKRVNNLMGQISPQNQGHLFGEILFPFYERVLGQLKRRIIDI